jgi:Flp pilus assembly protein TadG
LLTTIRRIRDKQDERGAALVEFALILPLLMSLVLGLVSGGAAYNRKLSMTGGVREGSRFGATLDGSANWASNVQSRTVSLSSGDLTTSQVCVKLVKVTVVGSPPTTSDVYSTSGCTASEPAAPSTVSVNDCLVKVWAARPTSFQAMFFSSTITLTASSVALYEGTVTGCN